MSGACPTPRRHGYDDRDAALRETVRRVAGTQKAPAKVYECRCGRWHLGAWRVSQLRAECENPGKVGYATQEAARMNARVMTALRGDQLFVYGDCTCGWWHLTSKFHEE